MQGVRESLDHAIEEALSKPDEGHPQLKTMLEVAIEHRLMHAETLAYMLHRLPTEKKVGERIVRTRANPRHQVATWSKFRRGARRWGWR